MTVPLFTAPCVRVAEPERTDAEVCAVRNTPTKGDRCQPCDGCLFPEAPGRRA